LFIIFILTLHHNYYHYHYHYHYELLMPSLALMPILSLFSSTVFCYSSLCLCNKSFLMLLFLFNSLWLSDCLCLICSFRSRCIRFSIACNSNCCFCLIKASFLSTTSSNSFCNFSLSSSSSFSSTFLTFSASSYLFCLANCSNLCLNSMTSLLNFNFFLTASLIFADSSS